MATKKVTCPVSAHLEEIESVDDPATGAIIDIVRCSAHGESGVATCAQLCAVRMNLGRARRASGELRVPTVNLDDDDAPADRGDVAEDEDAGGPIESERFTPLASPLHS